jgi:phosphoribosylformylglycinamidine synthase
MVGLIANAKHITTQSFKGPREALLLIGLWGDELGASHYLKIIHGRKEGAPPELDYDRELAVQHAVLHLIRKGWVRSAHDCSEGGFAVALAESAISGPALIGVHVDLSNALKNNRREGEKLRTDQILFNESQSRILLSVTENHLTNALTFLQEQGVPAQHIGSTTSEPVLRITAEDKTWEWSLESLRSAWADSIGKIMEE